MGKASRKKKIVRKISDSDSGELGSKQNSLFPKATPLLLIIIILLVSFAVYFNAIFNGFVYDDIDQILNNRWITDVRFIPDIFTSSVWGFQSPISNYYRPMTHLIFMLNYYIFGLKPWGFHLVNILFHAANSVLVFIIVRRLLSQSKPSESDPALPAFAASLLFATHPIQTEAVTWVSGLPDVSYTFFCLLSFYFYMRSEERSNGMYWLSVMSFALATLCKEPALMLPFILIAYDFAFRRVSSASSSNTRYPLHDIRYFFKRYIPYFAIALAYLGLRLYTLGGFSPRESYVKLSTYEYIINIFPLFVGYLEKLLLPLNLNVFHGFQPVYSIHDLKGILELAVTTAFLALTLTAFKKKRILFFSLLLIALPLLPTFYIPALGDAAFAERYLYLPVFGLALLLASAVLGALTAKRFTTSLFVISFMLTAAYSAATVSRNSIWKDEITLFTDMVKKSPDDARAHETLGTAYLNQNRIDEALIEFQTALKIKPYFARIYFDLGVAYEKTNCLDKAILEYETSVKLNPNDAKAHFNLGVALQNRNLIDEGRAELETALKLNPTLFRIKQEKSLQ